MLNVSGIRYLALIVSGAQLLDDCCLVSPWSVFLEYTGTLSIPSFAPDLVTILLPLPLN